MSPPDEIRVISASNHLIASEDTSPKTHVEYSVRIQAGGGLPKSTNSSDDLHWNELVKVSGSLSRNPNVEFTIELRRRRWLDGSRPFWRGRWHSVGHIQLRLQDLIPSSQYQLTLKELTASNHSTQAAPVGLMLIALPPGKNDENNLKTPEGSKTGLKRTRGVPAILEDLGEGFSLIATKLQWLSSCVDTKSKVYPMLSMTLGTILSVKSALRPYWTHVDQDIMRLLSANENAYSFIEDVRRGFLPSLTESIIRILRQTIECALFLQEYYTPATKLRSPEFLDSVTERINIFTAQFKNEGSGEGEMATFRMPERSPQTTVWMSDTPPVLFALNLAILKATLSSQLPHCLPQTRVPLLSTLFVDLISPSAERRICLLKGPAGSGKSTVAATLETIFRSIGRLGASIFFSYDFSEQSAPKNVIRSVAAQLALYDRRIAERLDELLDFPRGIAPAVLKQPLSEQFTKLLIEPLVGLESLHPEGPIIILLDGLDQCGSCASRGELLSVLRDQGTLLPSFVRILVTTRGVADILDILDAVSIGRDVFDTKGSLGDPDIEVFLRSQLDDIRARRNLPVAFSAPRNVASLAERASSSFLLAALSCQLIAAADAPDVRLDEILRHLQPRKEISPQAALDSLFTYALRSVAEWDSTFTQNFQLFFGSVMAAKEPLGLEKLKYLCMDGENSIPDTVQAYKVASSISKQFSFMFRRSPWEASWFHPSFYEFLVDAGRCSSADLIHPWYIDLTHHRQLFARRCILYMQVQLVPSLREPRRYIGSTWISNNWPELMHACRYWVDYITECPQTTKLVQEVIVFLLDSSPNWYALVQVEDHTPQLRCWLQRCDNEILAEDVKTAALKLLDSYDALALVLPMFPAGREETRLGIDHLGLDPESGHALWVQRSMDVVMMFFDEEEQESRRADINRKVGVVADAREELQTIMKWQTSWTYEELYGVTKAFVSFCCQKAGEVFYLQTLAEYDGPLDEEPDSATTSLYSVEARFTEIE